MRIKTETKVTVSSVALTKEEKKTLEMAQKILDNIWNELEEADSLDGDVLKIYNYIDEAGNSLTNIAYLAKEEHY